MALLGCDVISTDQTEVLPLLKRNIERNISRISQPNPDSDSFGSIRVAELNWGDADHVRACNPPFDYIIGTDVVYADHLLEPLLQTILSLSGSRTTVLLGYELRSTDVHDQMLKLWRRNFEFKSIPKSKMHREYQHPSIQLFMMNLKPSNNEIDIQVEQSNSEETKQISEENTEDVCGGDEACDKEGINQAGVGSSLLVDLQGKNLSEWETRRYGVMAARLLRDVKIT